MDGSVASLWDKYIEKTEAYNLKDTVAQWWMV